MKLDEAMLDGLTAECKTPEDVAGLYAQMLQRVINRGLAAELDAHVGYARHDKSEAERRRTAAMAARARRSRARSGK